ncbi:sigma-70 factor domain-containing protein [uncultured Nostoc sp.]|uniref:sigma-70 factor domain-containing protein n=1 Tax=uncultured Nostoc sp. TaxID=340711 RepID=UPI0026162CA7|nr:sigma-70 factor domain-containing protein [uncultured Nostoc sp.]
MPSPTTDLVRSYLKEIGRYPLLAPDQEITLARLVQQMMAVEQQRQAMSTTGYAYALQLNRQPSNLELATSLGQSAAELQSVIQQCQS